MIEGRWVFVGGALLVGILTAVVANRVGRRDIGASLFVLGLLILPQLLIPVQSRGWSNLIPLGVLALLALLAAGGFSIEVLLGVIILGGLTTAAIWLVGARVHGGVATAALGFQALGGLGLALGERARLVPLNRAANVQPDQQRYTAMGGQVLGDPIDPPPDVELDGKPAWWRAVFPNGTVYSSGVLRLLTEHGVAEVDGGAASVDLQLMHSELVHADDLGAAQSTLERADFQVYRPTAKGTDDASQQTSQPGEKPDSAETGSYNVHWFAPGTEVFVLGVPVWERAQAEHGGYRDAPLIPVFRGDERRPHLVDRPLRQARIDAWFDIVGWTVAAALFGIAAWLHAAGVA